MWGEQDSNLRRRTPADLQSAPVGRFGISPDLFIILKRTDHFKELLFKNGLQI